VSSLEAHSAATLFPLLEGEELQDLAEDIRRNGLDQSIVLHEGKVLDGRNRLRACEIAGVEPRFTQWEGTGDPTDWVVSTNLHRRHLTTSQRALIAVELKRIYEQSRPLCLPASDAPGAAPDSEGDALSAGPRPAESITEGHDLKRGRGPNAAVASGGAPVAPPDPARIDRSADKAARRAHVSRATVERAQKVVSDGAAELLDAVRAGAVTISRAAELAKLPPEQQREAVVRDKATPRPRAGRPRRATRVAPELVVEPAGPLDLTEFKAAYKRGPHHSKRTPLHEVPRLRQVEATAKLVLRAWTWINMEWDNDHRGDMRFALDEAKTMTPLIAQFVERLGALVFAASGERDAFDEDEEEAPPEGEGKKTT